MIVETFTQFSKMLTNLAAILDKAQKFSEQKKFDSVNLMNARLAPDQFNFIRQVQVACDTAKNGAARLTGIDAPKFEDNETTLAELQQRIRNTLEFLSTIKPEAFKGWETKKTLNPRKEGKYLPGDEFLHQHAIPNFYFHLTTAYSILRHSGVEIGKMDYLGAITYRDL